MRALKFFTILCLVSFSFFIAACNDDGGGSSDTGTVAMSVTDARPLLPENVTNLFVEFSEVWVHKPGDGWKQLDLVESPYTIDLLQFQDIIQAVLLFFESNLYFQKKYRSRK